ncbi:MAG: aminopeptidase P family protein [Lachnospiraceae bacterium]|nr:aminopeptidase P family protein [Lachnospiraceae bacterium]
MTIPERIQSLRQRMAEEGIAAYYIPTNDFHGSEYVGAYFKTREYISGFTGSAGTVIVTREEAGLWTDGRYYIQAEKQLEGSGIQLFRSGQEGVPDTKSYLQSALKEGEILGCDGRLVTMDWLAKMKEKFTLRCDLDLVGDIWEERPKRTAEPIWLLAPCYAGCSREEKLSRLWDWMKSKEYDSFILTSLDDIAWLLNIRGNDIPCNPVAFAYAIFQQDRGTLFCAKKAVSEEVMEALLEANISVEEYDAVEYAVRNIGQGKSIAVDYRVVNAHLCGLIPEGNTVADVVNPTVLWKAVKNDTEMDNERQAHIKDGVAITRLLYWLHQHIEDTPMTEISVMQKLEELRSTDKDYLGASFETIAGYAAHGAIVHYGATPETDLPLKADNFLLLDMGGQYYQGTTDITRTVLLGGDATEEQKKYYTAVLRGNLNLGAAKFKQGTSGVSLDILARGPLWEMGCDYEHGTGHGVGYLLNVHEGPNAIRHRISDAPGGNVPLQPGMLTSNEPGIYLENQYGIRLENLILCVEAEKTEFGQFLEFETLTLVPFDRRAIAPELMSDREKKLLNEYHQRVYEIIAPYLTEDERQWLQEECAPIKTVL